MFRRQILYFIILLLVYKHFVTASPAFPLIPREGEQAWPNFDWGKALEDTINSAGAFGSSALEFLQNQNTPEVPPTDSGSQSAPVAPATSDSPDNSNAQPSSSKPNHSPDAGAFMDTDTDTEKSPKTDSCEDANSCGSPVDQIIFTSSCETMDPGQEITDDIRAQNQAIWDSLVEMAPSQVRKSTSKVCDVFFFVAPLTAQQRTEMLKMPGVRLIIPNAHVNLGSAVPRSRGKSQPAGASTGSKSGQMQKRDFITTDSDAPDNLKFVSTPPGYGGIADAYYSYSASGKNTKVFSVGQGVEAGHHEFSLHPRPPIQTYLYGLGAGPLPKPDKLATCVASIVSGYKTGILKNADLIPVEIAESEASILDSLNQIIELVRMMENSTPAKGYVALLKFSWNGDDEFTAQVEYLFGILIRELNVVLVVVSWPDLTYRRRPIDDYPALLASNEYPIIVAGAVDLDGMVEDWSRSGRLVSVHAPAWAYCAATGEDSMWPGYGVVISLAHVGALAAYFLSLEDTGYLLRNDPQGVPWATRAWIERYAWSRLNDGDDSIWNRLGPPVPIDIPPIP